MFSVYNRMELILESINIIEERMLQISRDEDFVTSKEGLTILDSVTMRLQTIGENFNKVYKEDASLIENKLKIDIAPIIGFRNIISHYYELLDCQIIFRICTEQLAPLKKIISIYLNENN